MTYYKKSIEEIYSELKTQENGLKNSEIEEKQKKYGLNQLDTEIKLNPIKLFFEQFKSFIVYILIFATIISAITAYFDGHGDYIDSIIILTILILNALIGFFQEYSAEKNLEALKKLSTIEVNVKRNNSYIKIDSKELVPGDIIKLESGDKIPADCRIITSSRLKVEEAALTGESVPVEKNNLIIKKDSSIADRKNMLFSGTSISEGTAIAIVVKTGMNTEIGTITKLIKESVKEITPLQKKLDSFGKKLGYIVLGICAIIFLTLGLKNGFTLTNSLAFLMVAISLAVAAVPEGLPAVVTIALSVGVKKLLQKKALVRKLSSVETLGSCNVICTDKTGTLTKNQMTVENAWDINNETEIIGAGYSPNGKIENSKINNKIFEIGYFCNNATLYKKDNLWSITGDPTEGALIVSAKKAKIDENKYEKIDEIPFDSTRKMMSVLVEDTNKNLEILSKGSTTHILEKCSKILINGKEEKLTNNHIEKINEKMNEYSSKALRVLAFSYKKTSSKKDFTEDNLIFVGLQAMMDPPREEVIEAIKTTKKAGIRTIMITGDYITTAIAIGEKIGIIGDALTGEEINKMSDENLSNALKNNTNIFARVIPEHKQRIVKLLQEEGNTVAMTGDGVNDAPALKKSNIGIAVGSGCDVAKEAADFVLLNDSFASIVDAIEEGRGIYQNIQKSIMLLLSGNFGEVLIIFLAVLFNFNLPLTAILLLWINLVTDGAPALAFSVDPYAKNIMNRKPIPKEQGILPKKKMALIGFLGIVGSSLGLFLFNFFGGNTETGLITAQTVLFNFVVFYEIALVFFIRHEYLVAQLKNKWMWASIFMTIGLQLILMYTPLNKIFGIVGMSLIHFMYMFLAIVIFIICYILYNLIEDKIFPEEF